MFKFETMKKSIADAQKKKERKEFLNKVGNAAGTALGYAAIGVLATANAMAEADLQASSSYNSRTTSSGYRSSGYNSRSCISLSRNYMKDFMKSFGSIGTRFEDRLEMSFLHKSYDGDNAFVCYVNKDVRFHRAISGNEWRLYVARYQGIVYMALTDNIDSVIGTASATDDNFLIRFASEEIRNSMIIDIRMAVLSVM